MVFSKYLFSILAGLTGGVNIWAFTSSGGDIVGQELKTLDSEFENNSTENDNLIEGETKRLTTERTESETKFNELNSKNEDTKGKSRTRRNAGDSMQKESYKLDSERYRQNWKLNNTKTELETKLKSSLEEIKAKMSESVQNAHQQVKQAVEEENQKLEKALQTLQASNRQLIKTVRECIENMPYEIFVEDPKSSKCSPNALTRIQKQN